MTHESKVTERKISAFLARKAEQFPDVFDESEEPVPTEPRNIKVVFA